MREKSIKGKGSENEEYGGEEGTQSTTGGARSDAHVEVARRCGVQLVNTVLVG